MACNFAHCRSLSLSPQRSYLLSNKKSINFKYLSKRITSLQHPNINTSTLVSEAVRLFVPQANFEASKLKVVFLEEGLRKYSEIIPRTYILSHCDFTANLTLTISSVINLDQLEGWYNKDDVVAEWKKVNGDMRLHVHCCVSGPNPLQDLTAELRYHIFSKELPLVLKAILHGDSLLLEEHPKLMEAYVWVYFHSTAPQYNKIECWGALKDAVVGENGQFQDSWSVNNDSICPPEKLGRRTKSIFQALFAFLALAAQHNLRG